MKASNISIIQIEGVDGVGKTSLIKECSKRGLHRYAICDRGDLSDYVFAKLYHRNFIPSVNNQNALIILLIDDKDVIKNRLRARGDDEEEIAKVDLQDEYIRAAKLLNEHDYRVVIIDIHGLSISEVFERVLNILTAIPCFADAEDESEYSIWNRQYAKGAQKLGYKFRVIRNQPYINDIPICSEITCHNGVYETFENKKYPVNLIYAMGYDDFDASKIEKTVDFSYPIWSKINRRSEVFDYYFAWEAHGLTFLASSLHNKNYTCTHEFIRSTGNMYLAQLARAKATVYTARDLAYLKMQTARLYEAILANQIVFVDKKSDPDCEILTSMHHDKELIDLLYCTPDDICDKYNDALLIKNKILTNQREYYNKLVNDAKVFTAFETGEIL